MTLKNREVLDAGMNESDGYAHACGAAADDDDVVDVLTARADHGEIDLGGLWVLPAARPQGLRAARL